MLTSPEMCGDTESRKITPGVVVRLVGLDTMPEQNSVISKGKVQNYNNLGTGLAEEFRQCQWQEGDYFGNPMACEIQSFTHEEEFRDIYEVEQPPRNTWSEEQSPQKLRCNEDSYQRRMALVREKFLEAKNLATDGKLLDSKFQDAVEVLNSNRDLFLKFLEEPNSMFTKCIFEPRTGMLTDPWSLSQPCQKTRITVLKPSNTMDRKANRTMERRGLSDSNTSVGKTNEHYGSISFTEPRCDALSQPTRIVILKPSPGKPNNTKSIPARNFPTLHSSSGGLTCHESVSSREAVDGLRQQDQESLGRNIEDEAISSSVLSNGCTGHESSFDKSKIVYLEDEVESANHSKDEYTEENSQKNLSRSKSLPISSTHGADEHNAGMPSYSISKANVRKVAHKANNRSSWKDKISNFFLSRSKKPRGYKHSIVPSIDDVLSSFNATFTQQTLGGCDELYDKSTEISMFPEVRVEKSKTSGNLVEEQDKSNDSSVSPATLQVDVDNGLSLTSGGVSRSPPIESMARSLSGCTSCFDLASPKSLKPFMDFLKADEEHEQSVFLQNLLLYSGLDSKKRLVYKGWHSLDSPLNPSVLFESQNIEDEEKKYQEKHFSQNLLFDSINASLIDISEATLFAAYPWPRRQCHQPWKDGDSDATVAEQVWSFVRKRLVCNELVPKEPGIVVDRLAMFEAPGRQSDETSWLRVCELSKEIGNGVMEELVEELVSELSFHWLN